MKGKNKKIGGGGFHHVAMKARDFDASVRFYTEGLGFRKVLSWGEGDKRAVMLDTGDGACLEIFAGGPPEPRPEGAVVHFALRSSDPDAAIQCARQAGAVVTMEPKDVDIPSNPPTPVRIAFCKGPDGEVIEFFKPTVARASCP
jgi:glyoxylase I family protein